MSLLSTVNTIVGELNDNIYDCFGSNCIGDYYVGVDCSCDGNSIVIEFLGLQIWNSNDDGREFNEKTNKYEPLKPYLIKKIDGLIDGLSSLFFKEEI